VTDPRKQRTDTERLAEWAARKAEEQQFLADDESAQKMLRDLCRANAANFRAIASLLAAPAAIPHPLEERER
jgi:hypothetical protein